jgi:hypothetical protein
MDGDTKSQLSAANLEALNGKSKQYITNDQKSIRSTSAYSGLSGVVKNSKSIKNLFHFL